jgi:hypothetical protein
MPVLFPSHGDVTPWSQCIDWLNIARSKVVLTNHVPLSGRGMYSLRTGHSLPVEYKKLHLFPLTLSNCGF